MSYPDDNGHVRQASLDQMHSATRSMPSLVEGVVVAVYPPNHERNRSKVEHEYDVDCTSIFGTGRFRNVPRTEAIAGIDDGDDNILRAADSAAGASTGQQFVPDGGQGTPATPRYQTTGDRVVMGFVNGNPSRPVILGVLKHFKLRQTFKDVNGKDLKGRVRRMRHRGTEMVLDEAGNATLTFGKNVDLNGQQTDDKKKLTIVIGDFQITIDNSTSPTTATFGVKGGNQILKFTKNGFEVGASGLESMVLGDTLATFLSDLMTDYNSHQHTAPPGGGPSPIIPVGGPGLATRVGNIKSTWAKVSKNQP